ncbi:hypothetical protein JM18_003281 [Phytophthora kernoviae]|uniref:D-serine dehydratase-like domain-containing protein n=1 Tax=Phytophthora kernoviae TaxID=325452 RepID=A0A8T0M1U9_9STRA|nr:hypothetical protein JM16_003575 [Phytophthora kernoviae]KAG2528340.1 hypothetical protein JM18_003281 [Phytophthora kernoviae]
MSTREWMETPSVVLDETRLLRNIDRMQALATAQGVQLRPHAKTHKTREIAALQLSAGACGLTVSKPSEALQFLRGEVPGLKSLLLAYPVVQSNKVREVLKEAQQQSIEFLLTVDSTEGVDAAEEAAKACGCPLNLLIHVDVGYHRVGIEEDDPKLLALARRIDKSSSLEFRGLLSHAGMISVDNEYLILFIHLNLFYASYGVCCDDFVLFKFHTPPQIRPGNYVFLDRTPVRMGLCTVQDVALTVLATVVSSNKYNFIVDAGSKVLSSDGARSAGDFGSKCYGLAFYEKDFKRVLSEPKHNKSLLDDGQELICFEVTKLSEEHGWIKAVEGIPYPAIGQRLVIVPNHSCVVSNLTDKFYIQGKQSKTWSLLSRGCTQ